MKKSLKLWKNNRGAAMVSVMIAVAFIAILASALLYMSYSNFKMKVVNYESKVNFYETESDLTVITTGIRNKIAESSTPLQTLKDTVGYYEASTDVYRYNPQYLAKLIDNTVTLTSGPAMTLKETAHTLNKADGDKTFVSNMVAPTDSNFVVYTKTGGNGTLADATLASNEQKIVLKGVMVRHTEADDGYVNQLETDIVFRVMESPSSADPGGVGEFSVLMDSPISTDPDATDPIRITLYGNSFIGPGSYVDNAGNKLDPEDADALTLTGNSYFTQKGDYMMVFGNIVLKDQAVLNIAEGSLTVYGDIILYDDAVLMCSGELYMRDGFSIRNETGNNSNVVPSDLDTTHKITITETSYNSILSTLKLDDNNPDNDGIVNQIVKPDMRDEIENPGNYMNNGVYIDLWGMRYHTYFWAANRINNKDADASLCFLRGSSQGGHEMYDGANRNVTFISLEPVSFGNAKNTVLTQMGSAAFNYLTDGTHSDVPEIIIGDQALADNSNVYKLSDFFMASPNPTPNQVVNSLINNSVNGGGGQPIVDTAVGYENWTKE